MQDGVGVVAGDGAVEGLVAELGRLSDQLGQVRRGDGVGIEPIRERAAELLRGLTDQAHVFRKPGLADSYARPRPGNDRLTRYRNTLEALRVDIVENPQVWRERLVARQELEQPRAELASGVNIERLRLVENLRNNLEIAQGFFARNTFGESDPEHPEGWRFLRFAGEQLKPLKSPYAARFDELRTARGEAEALRDEAFRILAAALNELATEVYTLPKIRPSHILDRLDVIMTDANEVTVQIVHCANRSNGLRYLFQNLANELRNVCDSGRSQLAPGARSAARAVLDHLVEMSMKFNAMPHVDDAGEIFKEAYKLYGELPALLERAGEEFRLMREDEKKTGRAHVINVVGDVTNSHLHAGDNVAMQSNGASLPEILDLLGQLRVVFSELPEATRGEALDQLDGIEEQAKSKKPSRGVVRSLLGSLRRTAETGNQIADFTERVLPLLERLGPYLLTLAAAAAM